MIIASAKIAWAFAAGAATAIGFQAAGAGIRALNERRCHGPRKVTETTQVTETVERKGTFAPPLPSTGIPA